jgi:hypothetical protein
MGDYSRYFSSEENRVLRETPSPEEREQLRAGLNAYHAEDQERHGRFVEFMGPVQAEEARTTATKRLRAPFKRPRTRLDEF